MGNTGSETASQPQAQLENARNSPSPSPRTHFNEQENQSWYQFQQVLEPLFQSIIPGDVDDYVGRYRYSSF